MSLRDQTASAALLRALRDLFGDELSAQAGGPLRDALIEHYETSGGQSVNIEFDLGDGPMKVGTVSLPKNQDSVDVVDEAAYAKWVSAFYPSEAQLVLTINPAFKARHKKEVIADYGSGDVLDKDLAEQNGGEAVKVAGMKARRGQGFGTPSVKWSGDGKARLTEHVLTKTVQEALPAPSPAPQVARVDDADGVVEGEVVARVDGPAQNMTPAEVKKAKREPLRQECRRLEVDDTGNLTDIRARILAKYEEQVAAQAAGDRLAAMHSAMGGDA